VLVQDILNDLEGIAFVYLTDLDVVRHRLVQQIILAFARVQRERNGARAEERTGPGGREA
jgi:phosphate starvation-inducible PhoH-like protein